jgi:hypothetical protein
MRGPRKDYVDADERGSGRYASVRHHSQRNVTMMTMTRTEEFSAVPPPTGPTLLLAFENASGNWASRSDSGRGPRVRQIPARATTQVGGDRAGQGPVPVTGRRQRDACTSSPGRWYSKMADLRRVQRFHCGIVPCAASPSWSTQEDRIRWELLLSRSRRTQLRRQRLVLRPNGSVERTILRRRWSLLSCPSS